MTGPAFTAAAVARWRDADTAAPCLNAAAGGRLSATSHR